MELSGSEREQLQGALLSAFPFISSLEQMVLHKCNRHLDEFTSGALKNRVFELIKAAEAEGWTAELVAGGYAAEFIVDFQQPAETFLICQTMQWTSQDIETG